MKPFRPISKKWYLNYEYATKIFKLNIQHRNMDVVNLQGVESFNEMKARIQNNGHFCLHICDKLKHLTLILMSK